MIIEILEKPIWRNPVFMLTLAVINGIWVFFSINEDIDRFMKEPWVVPKYDLVMVEGIPKVSFSGVFNEDTQGFHDTVVYYIDDIHGFTRVCWGSRTHGYKAYGKPGLSRPPPTMRTINWWVEADLTDPTQRVCPSSFEPGITYTLHSTWCRIEGDDCHSAEVSWRIPLREEISG